MFSIILLNFHAACPGFHLFFISRAVQLNTRSNNTNKIDSKTTTENFFVVLKLIVSDINKTEF